MENNKVKGIIIEDENEEIEKFNNVCKKRNDFEILATTNSSDEGLVLVKKFNPDVVILDMELSNGIGSGFQFIEDIRKMKLKIKPKIYITTNVYSDSVYDYLHENKVDCIFYKKKTDYSAEMVINTIVLLGGFKSSNNVKNEIIINDNNKTNEIIKEKINEELDLIGVGNHLQGRKYLFEAIYYLLADEFHESNISITQYLVSKFKKASSTVNRAMQNAIIHAWRISSIDDLERYYKAKINYETGVPTPVEFIYYYVDKIKKML